MATTYQEAPPPFDGWIDTETGAWIPNDPDNTQCQEVLAWIEDGNTPTPAPPPPVVYGGSLTVDETVRTTDDVPREVFRFPTAVRHVYRATFGMTAIDAGSGACKDSEVRLVFKRTGAGVAQVGATVVLSSAQDAAAASWAIQAAIVGTDLAISVRGAAGRTIDWLLVGTIGTYAPDGLEG